MLDHPGGLVELTTRTQHGRLLLLPSEKTNDRILGVLGRAQAKYTVIVHAFNFQANHAHIMGTMVDEEQMALFMAYLNGNLAKELGRLHGWREKFWGRRYHSASISLDENDQIRRYKYILANGCKEGLVSSPLDWPGVSSAPALYHGEMEDHGTWYDRTAQYRLLVGLADRYVDAVHEIEEQTARMHKENGTRPMGARAIRRQKPHDKPKAFKPSPAPIIHAANRETFWAMYNARQAKVAAYRDAAGRLKRGETDVRFPDGCFPPRLPFVKAPAPT